MKLARAARALAALAARRLAALAFRGIEDGDDPSRPVPPALPSDAWALIVGREAPSFRCATGPAGMGHR